MMKTEPKSKSWRVKFVDSDGSLVMNRVTEERMYVCGSKVDTAFLEYSIGIDAREHGVKILKWDLTPDGLVVLVEYL